MFVTIEGTDASGKNTQSEVLQRHLGGSLISFPAYDTTIGELIDRHLKKKWRCGFGGEEFLSQPIDATHRLNALVFQSLHVTNRLEVSERIRRNLEQGTPVIADRYWPSGWVYGAADGLDKYWLEEVHKPLIQPDLFILIDIDVEESFKRRPERRDRYEADKPFLTKVIELYRELWRSMENRTHQRGKGVKWVVVDGKRARSTVEFDIQRIVEDCRMRLADGTW